MLNQLYQAIIDAAQYVEVTKPMSTLSYVNTMGEEAFVSVNPLDIKNRDLKVYVTSRAEDKRIFDELRQLAQPMLQNGASVYDVAVLYTTNSVRQMKETFRDLKEKQEEFTQQQQQLEQQKLQQEQQIAQAQLEQAAQEAEQERINENYNKELDRLNKKEVAVIAAYARNNNALQDTDNNGEADALEVARMTNEQTQAQQDYNMKLRQAAQKDRESADKMSLEREKLKLEREKLDTQIQIEKIKLKNKVPGEK